MSSEHIEELEAENRMLRARNDRLQREISDRQARHDAPPQPTGIEAKVCSDIAARQALGVAKYGMTVKENPLPLRAWLQHAYEECLDQAVYLRRAMHEMDKGAA